MKAVVFRSKEHAPAIETVGVKSPGAGEVRVRLHAAGLCHSDLSVIDGSIPGRPFHARALRPVSGLRGRALDRVQERAEDASALHARR
jgi:D-arabinose 1-dehydrogenase-like Zn-dependent alcohol dehydrogenase